MSSSVVVQPEAEELLAFTTSTAPQIVKLTTKKPNKKWKKTKKNTLALTDIVFSTTFLTALVVGCWRGLWGLMDVYSHYFPYGEAYILSMVCQMIFTYSQTGLHKMFVRNRSQNRSLLAECFAKIYTCLSCVICILNWQSGWSVYDYHMKILGVGNVMTAPGSVLIMTIVSAVCLMMVKGLINTIACPFVIALDEWNDIFTISTRFQTKLLVLVFYPRDTSSEPAGLVAAESIKRQDTTRFNPRPFQTNYNGLPPQQFATTTVHPTTISYPQLTNYRNKYYPNNIQEILGYVTKAPKRTKQQAGASTLEVYREHSSGNQDPFHNFKPKDPGEINLLATASFRFAPPLWSHSRNRAANKQPKKPQDNYVQESVTSLRRPIVVTLNIYPNEEQVGRPLQHRTFPYRFQNPSASNKKGVGNFKLNNPNKMTIHLNLYPEGGVIEQIAGSQLMNWLQDAPVGAEIRSPTT